MYSNDRTEELLKTLECMRDMDFYEECQVMLCVDGKFCNISSNGLEIVFIERPESGLFCWAKCWDICVEKSICDKILYLDSDRVLPKNYLQIINDCLEDGMFMFPGSLYSLKERVSSDVLRAIRDKPEEYTSLLKEDHRVDHPSKAICRKNPMSGCTAFTRKTFVDSGGLDWGFQGWGYPDTDYFRKTYQMGFKFNSIDCVELHQKHDYVGGVRTLRLHNLWNGMRYVKKWELDIPEYFYSECRDLGVNLKLVEKYSDVASFASAANLEVKFL